MGPPGLARSKISWNGIQSWRIDDFRSKSLDFPLVKKASVALHEVSLSERAAQRAGAEVQSSSFEVQKKKGGLVHGELLRR
jgi:hypothetical protein